MVVPAVRVRLSVRLGLGRGWSRVVPELERAFAAVACPVGATPRRACAPGVRSPVGPAGALADAREGVAPFELDRDRAVVPPVAVGTSRRRPSHGGRCPVASDDHRRRHRSVPILGGAPDRDAGRVGCDRGRRALWGAPRNRDVRRVPRRAIGWSGRAGRNGLWRNPHRCRTRQDDACESRDEKRDEECRSSTHARLRPRLGPGKEMQQVAGRECQNEECECREDERSHSVIGWGHSHGGRGRGGALRGRRRRLLSSFDRRSAAAAAWTAWPEASAPSGPGRARSLPSPVGSAVGATARRRRGLHLGRGRRCGLRRRRRVGLRRRGAGGRRRRRSRLRRERIRAGLCCSSCGRRRQHDRRGEERCAERGAAASRDQAVAGRRPSPAAKQQLPHRRRFHELPPAPLWLLVTDATRRPVSRQSQQPRS